MQSTRTIRTLIVAIAASLALAACAGTEDAAGGGATGNGGTSDTATDAAEGSAQEGAGGADTTGDDAGDDTASDDAGDDADSDQADGDAGAGDAATDGLLGISATTPDGSTITLAEFVGRPVLVETFATWCSTCRAQLGDTQQAAAQAGDDAVFLALSVETALDPASLERYAADNGFQDVRFGVLDGDALVTLQEQFGGTVLNPPSTPKFRIAPDGSVSELTTGPETSAEILDSLAG